MIVAGKLHQVDQYTYALWQLGDIDPKSAVDLTGRLNMPASATVGVPSVVPGLVFGAGNARQFNSDIPFGDYLESSGPPDYPLNNLAPYSFSFENEWTIEAWINVQLQPTGPLGGNSICVMQIATNTWVYAYLGVSADMTLNAFWGWNPYNYDGYVDVYDSTPLSLNTTYHIAVRKRNIEEGLCAVDFFINGVPTSTVVGLHNTTLDSANPYSSCSVMGTWSGYTLQSVRVSTIARSNLEISRDYAQGIQYDLEVPFVNNYSTRSPGKLHQLDQYTVALWQLGDTDPLVADDLTGNFNCIRTATVGNPQTTQGLVGGTGNARQFNLDVVYGDFLQSWYQINSLRWPNPLPVCPFVETLLGEMTIEAWIVFGVEPPSSWVGFVSFIQGSAASIYFGLGPDYTLNTYWSYGNSSYYAGIWYTEDNYEDLYDKTTLSPNTRYHVATRRRMIGDGLWAVDFFINGALSSTVKATSGAGVGGSRPNYCSATLGAGGVITMQSIRVSSIARSNAEIAKSYASGA